MKWPNQHQDPAVQAALVDEVRPYLQAVVGETSTPVVVVTWSELERWLVHSLEETKNIRTGECRHGAALAHLAMLLVRAGQIVSVERDG